MKPQDEKAKFGEEIVREWLRARGHMPSEWTVPGYHPLDMFCFTRERRIYGIDVKTYARRMAFADTGINYDHFLEYWKLQKAGLDVWLFFVDHVTRSVYGQLLDDLMQHRAFPKGCGDKKDYPRKEGGKIYFPLEAMVTIFRLSDAQVEILQGLTRGRRGHQPDLQLV